MAKGFSKNVSTDNAQPGVRVRAWMQVVGSFFLYMNTLGMINSYGAFQTYYATQLIPDEPSSKISWIGSMQAFLLFFIGFLIGPLLDAGYLTYLLTTGTSLICLGLIFTSLCFEYYQLMLAQGIMVGLGLGCLFLPSVSIVPQWFNKKETTMYLGIIGTGSAIGAIMYPVVFKRVLESGGFGWAVRSIAFITLPTNLLAVFALQMRTLPPTRRDFIDLGMFKETTYILDILVNFFGFAGLYIPIFFLEQYAATFMTISSTLTEYIVPIMMAGSLPGRLIPNMLAVRYGIPEVVCVDLAICAILCFCWIPIKTGVGALIIYSLLYGFVSGGFTSLAPPLIINLAPNMNKIGTRVGMNSAIFSFGILMGNPVAGAILTSTHEYIGLQCFAGSLLAVATILVGIIIYQRSRKHGELLAGEPLVKPTDVPLTSAKPNYGQPL